VHGLLAALLIAFAAGAWGQTYPTRPVRLVVPFPAGGTTDINARTLAAQLERQLGHAIVADNRAGASGIIACDIVAKAAPDGHTLLYVSSSIALNPNIFRKLPYDTVRDFAPVTRVASAVGFLLVVSPSLTASSLKEFIALGKAPDTKLSFGSAGIGNPLHLAGEVFNLRAGTHMLHVPYKGVAPAITAVIGGEVQALFTPPPAAVAHIKTGKLRALGFSGTARWAVLPDVPTFAETVPGLYVPAGWDGLFAPSRTPAALVNKLQAAVRKALDVPKVSEAYVSGGYEPAGSTPEEFRRFFVAEIKRYAKIVRDAKIQSE
jgi:tripartite-type tricarboxylate transporter receptor subunit TctC